MKLKKLDIEKFINKCIDILEYCTSVFTLAIVLIFLLKTIVFYFQFDFTGIESFYTFINHILAIAVGIELVKLVVIRKPKSILRLLMFIIARKLVGPDITIEEILFGCVAFSMLFLMHVFTPKNKNDDF